MVGRYSQKSDKHLNSKVLGEVSSKIGSDAAKCLQESGQKNQISTNIRYQQCLLNIFIYLFIVYTMPQQNEVRCCEAPAGKWLEEPNKCKHRVPAMPAEYFYLFVHCLYHATA